MCCLNSSANEFREFSTHPEVLPPFFWYHNLAYNVVPPSTCSSWSYPESPWSSWLFFKRFKTIFCDVETESIFIIFIRFLKYSLWTFNIAIQLWPAILKTYAKPASYLTTAIDWTRPKRHRFRKPSFSPVHT